MEKVADLERKLDVRKSLLVFICVVAAGCAGSQGGARETPVEVPVQITREVTVEVIRKVPVEVTREVLVEIEVTVLVEVEVTREIPVTVEVVPTPTPIPSATPTPSPTPTPAVDVRDVDYVRDIEVPADFVEEATNIAVAYCDGRTYSADTLVLNHFGRQTVGGWHTYGFVAETDDCRSDVLAAMAVRSKLMSLAFRRYIAEADGYLQCYDKHYTASPERLKRECPYFEEMFPARHLPGYDREKLIVMFEDQPPEYPLDYLLTEDELWARSQIWRSLVRFFHFHCIRKAASAQGRTLILFDRDSYIGYLPNLGIVDADIILPHLRGWGYDGPGVGLCSAYDIKVRAEYAMWERYDVTYFGYLANGVPAGYEREPGSADFYEAKGDLAGMRANPPEMPNRFAAE